MGYGIHPKSRRSHLKMFDLITSGTTHFSRKGHLQRLQSQGVDPVSEATIHPPSRG